MRTFLISFVVVLVALIFANGNNASAMASGENTAVESSASLIASVSAASDQAEHCGHIPCANSAHSHASSSCSAHSFVAMGDDWIALSFHSAASIVPKTSHFVGRTLLPPVPPPLG